MKLKRRDFLLFLGAGASVLAIGYLKSYGDQQRKITSFRPVKGAMPLSTDGIPASEQIAAYSNYEVMDDLVLPEGFTYEVVAAWGDPVGDSRFGYNNDYLAFIETADHEGYLTVNFEYISAVPWLQTYQQVIGKSLPFSEVQAAVKSAGEAGTNAYALPDNDPLKAKIRDICQEALLDQGMGVISIRKTAEGKWERTNSTADRRISGISGLEDGRYLKVTGPAKAVFRKTKGQGYLDGLGERIIGTFGNCAGGTTPWGTVLSGEENFQNQVPEPVYADGTAYDPKERTFAIDKEEITGQGNVFGLSGNKYGWIVEIDPADPNDYGTKHTWLGRYRHEAVGVRVETGKPLAFYSGCDRRGGHIYKFVSRDLVRNPKNKANSQLLQNGMLYAAKFNSDGTGRWIPLKSDTSVDPDLPSNMVAGSVLLPSREGGKQETSSIQNSNVKTQNSQSPASKTEPYLKLTRDNQIASYKQQFKKLGDLYAGNPEEKQGAILIDAHYAANAAGATYTGRPEDTEIAPDGSLFITFTSGSPGEEGSPDKRIFKGPNGEIPYEYGWVMRLLEEGNDPAAQRFSWKMMATGGEPADGGLGFSNPDNLSIDPAGNVWMVTDMSTSKHNKAVPSRLEQAGKSKDTGSLVGLFGNNAIWYIPTTGENAGKAYLFGMGPMECETTGPCFTRDQQTLFLSVQHPGEGHGIRKEGAVETRQFAIKTMEGQELMQTRTVPIGSNWPGKGVNDPPKPAVVAIRRLNS